ncbi:hypothetical protein CASFOL_020023 [Castilleja foliolosa]|uniref:DUF674 family protein n=1 Tax=Castilleja foliolosa TaxID=1961234 RepID=A0ABD3D1N8_9LAMI
MDVEEMESISCIYCKPLLFLYKIVSSYFVSSHLHLLSLFNSHNKMSDITKDVKFSLKVVINKQKTKVLFAEIDSDLADVLFSFLTLPLGKIVRILKKHYRDEAPVFGSITTLYDGLSNLESSHFWTEGGKQMLLNPTSSFIDECRRLKLDIGDNQPIKYFSCENLNSVHYRANNMAMYYDTVICDCGKQLKKEIQLKNVSNVVGGEVFTIRTATFILSDDLQILPNLRNVTFGFNEIMDFFKYSLISPTPLTNVVLKNQTKYEPGTLVHQIGKISSCYSVLTLKAYLQKSTNKFLFAEAEEYFVEFLFSFLIISLGGVKRLLGNTSLKNTDNLYQSLYTDEKFLSQGQYKLRSPSIPYGYLSTNSIFTLTEEESPNLYYYKNSSTNEEYLTFSGGVSCIFKSPRGHEKYMKGPRKYMVKDDLTVTFVHELVPKHS